MIPLLICAYKPRYLEPVLGWLRQGKVGEKYRIFVWDNGEASDLCAKYGAGCYAMRDKATKAAVNVGKAMAMRHLVNAVQKTLPDADCYVCMDDDIIVDREHLDALVAAARRPGLGMIGPRYHPFNSVTPADGTITEFDPCPTCQPNTSAPVADCSTCHGSGKDPDGLRLRVYPAEDRTVRQLGRLAGGLFAISKATIAKLKWAPYLYPLLVQKSDKKPVLYWPEDAILDQSLTSLGFTNGYLDMPTLNPVIHLPDLNIEYMMWKRKSRSVPPDTEFQFG